ncbi:PilZ domain-containing protein [Campylobacter pinnipediorum subsp. pinnipediorum]|uniref:PilZ domain-containing protein n=1 Tax=Campylobacter pinnipediorum TaxID=1965231 RepID=UPI000995C767|nr:PilZ domain-containing protein [Campylobacter pinnipediorum]AQW81729.1 PilZ domain-containing protein [Campylobacter pinnipediorum subsp. pinnipediorum]
MIFMDEYFQTQKIVFNELKSSFIDSGLHFCEQNTKTLNKDDIAAFFEDLYCNIINEKENMSSLQNDFKKFSSENKLFKYSLDYVLINFIFLYSKKSDKDTFLKQMILRIEFIKKSMLARITLDLPSSTFKISTDTFFEHPINTFKKMKDLDKELVFLNLYDGVNVKNSGHIISTSDSSVTIQVDIIQILAMKEEGNAFILQNEFFSKHLKADIIDFNITAQTVTLSNFKRMDVMNANKRKHQRVTPNKFTKVLLKGTQDEVLGNMYDISKGGLSVLTSQDIKFKQGEEITAIFKLAPDNEDEGFDVTLNLKLVVQMNYNGFMRYCMQNSSETIEPALDNFIDKRVDDIFRELKELKKLYI